MLAYRFVGLDDTISQYMVGRHITTISRHCEARSINTSMAAKEALLEELEGVVEDFMGGS